MSDTIIGSIIVGVCAIIAAVIGMYSYIHRQSQKYHNKGHKDTPKSEQSRMIDRPEESADERNINDIGKRYRSSPTEVDLMILQNLVERVKEMPEQPDTILAVQTQGLWVAEVLRDKLEHRCRIISAEKEIEKGRLSEYHKIPVKGTYRKNRNKFFYIAHKELTNSRLGNVVIADNYVETGKSVLSIIDGLDCNIKAVVTISVNKSHVEDVESGLQQRGVQLIRATTGGENIYQSNRQNQ